MTHIRALVLLLSVSALAVFAAAEPVQEDDLDVIIQYKKDAPPIPQTKVIKDDYVSVDWKYKGMAGKRDGYLIQEVQYADKDANYALALEKRDEGRYPLAALHFTNALENMKAQKWAPEYCNYNIGNAFFSANIFNGYKGRALSYAPAAEYFKRALEANPKSRYMLDIVAKLPVCYAEQGKLAEADTAITDADERIKKYTDETGKLGLGYAAPAERARAQLAIAKAHISEKRVTLGEKGANPQGTHDLWHEARLKCAKFPDLVGECVDGELRGLIMMKQYAKAIAEANGIIEKFNIGNDYTLLAQLPAAYMSLGQANLAQGIDFEKKGNPKSNEYFAEARWAFLNVIAQFFDNDDYVAQAHFLAGFCYEKLKDVEPADALKKAIREWQSVVTNFPKSAFKDEAVANLKRLGVKVEETAPPAPKAPPAAKPDAPKPDAPKPEKKPKGK